MARTSRRTFTAEQKVRILRQHLLEQVPVSEVCETHQLQPSLFYAWQRKLFENGAAALNQERDTEKRSLQRTIDTLKEKLVHKDQVIAQVTEEFVKVKKQSGEL